MFSVLLAARSLFRVHPRDKQDVAARSVLGARTVAYGDDSVPFRVPFPTRLIVNDPQQALSTEYDQRRAQLDVRGQGGFEVQFKHTCFKPVMLSYSGTFVVD